MRIENSVTRVSRDAEQLSRVTEFSIGTEKSLSILFIAYFPSTIAFKLEYALLDQFYAKKTECIFHKEMFGSASIQFYLTSTSKRLAENYLKN